jgi:hypothetical protein
MSDQTQSFVKYPAAQVAKMAKATIEQIYSSRRRELLKDYHAWAENQNKRTFNWFGLVKLKKYPLNVEVVKIDGLRDLPRELREFVVGEEGEEWADLAKYFMRGCYVLDDAKKILRIAENVLGNENISDKTIYLSVEDFNTIS